MVAKAKNYREIVKKSVSLSPVGYLLGYPCCRGYSLKGDPADNAH